MNRAHLAITCALVLASAAAVADQVYKWVDKDGHVHFSQTPPAATEAQPVQVNVPPPDPTGLQNSQTLQQQQADKDKQAKEQAEQNKPDPYQEALKKQHCDDLKSRLALLQQDRRAAMVDAQGNVNYLDDDARAQQVREIQSQLKDQCGK